MRVINFAIAEIIVVVVNDLIKLEIKPFSKYYIELIKSEYIEHENNFYKNEHFKMYLSTKYFGPDLSPKLTHKHAH